MSTDVAIKHIAIQSIRSMKEDDAGGGNGGGRNELKLKRKSDELTPEIGGKKMKKQWKTIRRKKLKGKKISKKPGSPDGDKPSSGTKKVTTTTAPSSGGTGKRRRRRMTESFNAPFNSTQFLMNDHKTEAVRHLDSTLNGGGRKNEVNVDEDDSVDITMEERPLRRITRARESSFSIDSDDDYYYSSPEDEEEFMSREFMKDYDNLRNDRLIDLSKDELINEYLQMEEKIEALEKRLSRQSSSTNTDVANNVEPATDQNENENDDTNSKEAMADTILQFQKEIQRLESENDQLKLTSTQNAAVPPAPTGCSSSCSSSSESDDSESESDSDSDDSNDSSESDSDNGEEEVTFKQVISGEKKLSSKVAEKGLEMDCEVEGDTGYESGHSNKPVHPGTNNTTGTTEGGINPNEEKEVVVNGNLTENGQKDENEDSGDDLESETESCPELISVNCITSTSP